MREGFSPDLRRNQNNEITDIMKKLLFKFFDMLFMLMMQHFLLKIITENQRFTDILNFPISFCLFHFAL
jgi:hypothetical protein